MNEDAGTVKGQLGGPAQRSVLKSLFFTGQVSSLEKALWKHLSLQNCDPIEGKFILSSQHPAPPSGLGAESGKHVESVVKDVFSCCGSGHLF